MTPEQFLIVHLCASLIEKGYHDEVLDKGVNAGMVYYRQNRFPPKADICESCLAHAVEIIGPVPEEAEE